MVWSAESHKCAQPSILHNPQVWGLLRPPPTLVCEMWRRRLHTVCARISEPIPSYSEITDAQRMQARFAQTTPSQQVLVQLPESPDIQCHLVKGPSPKQLLYSSLASCTMYTLQTFVLNSAKSAPILWGDVDLRNITCHVSEVMSPGEQHLPAKLLLEIVVAQGSMTAGQQRALVRASAFCPVKRMMAVEIETVLKSIDCS